MAYASDNGYVFDNRPIFRGGVKKETLSGAKELNESSESFLKNSSSSAHAFVIQDDAGSPVIGGSGLAAGKAAMVVCDGTNWHVVFQQA